MIQKITIRNCGKGIMNWELEVGVHFVVEKIDIK
jgi:hypothetical protein